MLSERIKKRILELYYNRFSYRDIVSQIKKEFHKKIGIATISRLVKNEKTGKLNVVRKVKQTPKKRRLTISEIVDQYNSHDKGIKTVVKHVLAPSGRKRGSARMVSSDPVEQEFDAENRGLAQEAHRLGLEDLIVQRKHNIAKIKKEEKKNKISYNEPAFRRGLTYMANQNLALANEVLDSANSKQEQLFNYFYSKYPTENLMIPLLTLINRDKISVKDIIEIAKMVWSTT